jgi:hypothetical protein
VYANTFNGFGGNSEFVVEQGALVRENQVLIRLPDPTKMQVKATVNESRISLIRADMPVSIEFDAIRGRKLQGRVTRVNQYAEPTSWRSGNIKEYAAYVEIFDPPPEVRSGMIAGARPGVIRDQGAVLLLAEGRRAVGDPRGSSRREQRQLHDDQVGFVRG